MAGRIARAIRDRISGEPFKRALIHPSDRGSQYLTIRNCERFGEAGIALSGGSVGDS
jgi:hypothetical protein